MQILVLLPHCSWLFLVTLPKSTSYTNNIRLRFSEIGTYLNCVKRVGVHLSQLREQIRLAKLN